jgi:uncharacterized membrane protein
MRKNETRNPSQKASGENAVSDNEQVLLRIHAFSDGVFAFAITLLILDVRLPADIAKADLGAELLALWPNYLAFLLSFIVIGVYWMSHVQMFREIADFDQGMIWLNLLYLLFIVVIPFSTSVLSLHFIQLSVMVYAGVLACAGYMHTILRFYIRRHPLLVRTKHTAAYLQKYVRYSLIMPVGFTLSVCVAPLSTAAAQIIWILIFG